MPIQNGNSIEKIYREECNYRNCSEKFKPPENNFVKQYYHIYVARMNEVKKRLLQKIEEKWENQYPVCRIGEVGQQSSSCIVIGTLFKDQQLKPSILKELSEENQLMPPPPRTHFTDDSDVLILEDELQRIELLGVLKVHDVVSGIPCAILGVDADLGQFQVLDYLFLDCPRQIERPLLEDDRYVVFISGLDLANKEISLLPLQLFVDWVIGLSVNKDQKRDISKICRVIIAGNSIRTSQDTKTKKSLISKNIETEDTFEAVKLLDEFLTQLVKHVFVDLMPGEFDPSNYMLPQQPLHYCMFPGANKYITLNGVTNPYQCEIEGLRFLGSSGQPVMEIGRYSRIEDPLEELERCIKWSHLCPTAPDTLSCFPYYDKDPFIINECPHVAFAGNQQQFQTKIYKGPENQEVRLICVPEFSKTQTVCVLNLKNYECYPISFKLM